MIDISHLFIHSLTWQRKPKVPAGGGRFIEGAAVTLDTIDGRVNAATAKDLMVAQQKQAEVKWVIYLPYPTAVMINDLFIYDGRTLRVTVPDAETPSYPIYQKVFTVEAQTNQ